MARQPFNAVSFVRYLGDELPNDLLQFYDTLREPFRIPKFEHLTSLIDYSSLAKELILDILYTKSFASDQKKDFLEFESEIVSAMQEVCPAFLWTSDYKVDSKTKEISRLRARKKRSLYSAFSVLYKLNPEALYSDLVEFPLFEPSLHRRDIEDAFKRAFSPSDVPTAQSIRDAELLTLNLKVEDLEGQNADLVAKNDCLTVENASLAAQNADLRKKDVSFYRSLLVDLPDSGPPSLDVPIEVEAEDTSSSVKPLSETEFIEAWASASSKQFNEPGGFSAERIRGRLTPRNLTDDDWVFLELLYERVRVEGTLSNRRTFLKKQLEATNRAVDERLSFYMKYDSIKRNLKDRFGDLQRGRGDSSDD